LRAEGTLQLDLIKGIIIITQTSETLLRGDRLIDMEGYIVNTDKAWFEFLLRHKIDSPVFWFKRESNPSSRALVKDNYFFFRITGINPPSIMAYGIIFNLETLSLQKAFDKYGNRLGYDTTDEMIEHSSRWTSTVALKPDTRIFCVEVKNFRTTELIRVDTDLQSIGIVFDYQHVVT